jgi:hypothetical protein
MRCSSRGCKCSYCGICGERYENCICELKERTKQFIDKTYMGEAIDDTKAVSLLKEWLRVGN